ncbi:MAG TPA: hypothetical protein VGL10_07980, partial [Gammaproteobacteria bacterium]
MKQQINFYQAEFHEPEIALSADHIFLLTGGMLALMFLVSTGLGLLNIVTQSGVSSLRTEVEMLKQENERINAQLQARSLDKNLAGNAADAARQLQARQNILQLVESSEKQEDTVHFSDLLAG